jgi:hypothetical protein
MDEGDNGTIVENEDGTPVTDVSLAADHVEHLMEKLQERLTGDTEAWRPRIKELVEDHYGIGAEPRPLRIGSGHRGIFDFIGAEYDNGGDALSYEGDDDALLVDAAGNPITDDTPIPG